MYINITNAKVTGYYVLQDHAGKGAERFNFRLSIFLSSAKVHPLLSAGGNPG
jgi:hypothetical protein